MNCAILTICYLIHVEFYLNLKRNSHKHLPFQVRLNSLETLKNQDLEYHIRKKFLFHIVNHWFRCIITSNVVISLPKNKRICEYRPQKFHSTASCEQNLSMVILFGTVSIPCIFLNIKGVEKNFSRTFFTRNRKNTQSKVGSIISIKPVANDHT